MNTTPVQAAGMRPSPPLPDIAHAARAADGAAGQLVALLRAGPDPSLTAVGRWTVRDVAAHVAGGAELYAQIARGTPSPAPTIEAITALNDQIIAAVGEQELPALSPTALKLQSADFWPPRSAISVTRTCPGTPGCSCRFPPCSPWPAASTSYMVTTSRTPPVTLGRCQPAGPGRCSRVAALRPVLPAPPASPCAARPVRHPAARRARRPGNLHRRRRRAGDPGTKGERSVAGERSGYWLVERIGRICP